MLNFKNQIAQEMYNQVVKDYPKAQYEVNKMDEYMVSMRDNVKLCTRVFYSKNMEKPYDVLVIRNPYPANQELYEGLYLPFVEQGYCLVMQDCRGTGKSQGNWQPFENERLDGIDTLNWLQKQGWVGQIATFGRSYSAYTQWIVGDKLPDKVKTMFLEVYGVNRFDQVYNNGIFREDIYTSWAFGNSGVKSDIPVGTQYKNAIKINPANTRDQKILNCKLPFYQDYLSHIDRNSSYWKEGIWNTLEHIPSKINVPVVVTDGWADHHLEGSLQGFNNLKATIQNKSCLIITPTDHMNELTGALEYPNCDRYGFMNMTANLVWFNHILKKHHQTLESGLYQMRGGQWRTLEDLKNISSKKLYLARNQLVNAPKKEIQTYVYNPQKSNVWPGGNELLAWISPGFTDLPHGFTKFPKYDQRPDVLVFTSYSYDEDFEICGEIKLNLKVSTDREDTAFCMRLCELTKDNEYINIKDTATSILGNEYLNLDEYIPNKQVKLSVSFGHIIWKIHKSSSLVLLISSNNFPMYATHSNKKGIWSQNSLEDTLANQTIYLDEDTYLTMEISK